MADNDNVCCKCTTPQYTLTLNAQGPQGISGKNGQDGISPTISVKTNNASTYILEISDINGTFTTPNLKPVNNLDGGTPGQLLTKYGNGDGEYNWQDFNLPSTLLYKDKTLQYVTGSIIFLNSGDLTSASGLAVMNTTSGNGVGLGFTPSDIVLVDTVNGVANNTTGYFYNTKNLVAGNNVTITQNQEAGTWSINATAEPYTLPQATADTLGGIKAETKTDDDTQPVRIDTTTGLLYTKAGGASGTIDGGNAFSISETAVINNISKRIDTNEYPTVNTVTDEITITTPEPEESE